MANAYESLSFPGNRVASLNLNNSWPTEFHPNSVRSDRAVNSCLESRTCRLAGSRPPLPSIFTDKSIFSSFHSLSLAKVTRSHSEVTAGRIVRFCRQLSRRYRTRTSSNVVVDRHYRRSSQIDF